MNTQPRTPDPAAIKERQQKAWSSGNYSKQGVHFVIIAELLCEAVDLRPGRRVLDVATGNGNTAMAAARRFCEVTGIDRVRALLEDGRNRAAAEGFRVDFQEGDAENLPFPDTSFDFVLSTIGAMFSPDQEKVASELLRVCRPGGRIGMANWTPDSFVGELSETIGKHVPPPPGSKSPFLWGTEERLRELFGGGVTSLWAPRRSFVFRYPSPQLYMEYTRTHYGPLVKALEALDASGQEALVGDVEDLVHRFNRSGDETMAVPINYLEVVAIKRWSSFARS
jgi:ubiquinone/menaquinone biosynthesis C-methylase UbiE